MSRKKSAAFIFRDGRCRPPSFSAQWIKEPLKAKSGFLHGSLGPLTIPPPVILNNVAAVGIHPHFYAGFVKLLKELMRWTPLYPIFVDFAVNKKIWEKLDK